MIGVDGNKIRIRVGIRVGMLSTGGRFSFGYEANAIDVVFEIISTNSQSKTTVVSGMNVGLYAEGQQQTTGVLEKISARRSN